MRMGIDEPRRDDEPARVDRSARRHVRACGVTDERDSVAGDGDVGIPCRGAGAVDDPAVSDEDVGRRALCAERSCRRARRQQKQGERSRQRQPGARRGRTRSMGRRELVIAQIVSRSTRRSQRPRRTPRTIYVRRGIKSWARVTIIRILKQPARVAVCPIRRFPPPRRRAVQTTTATSLLLPPPLAADLGKHSRSEIGTGESGSNVIRFERPAGSAVYLKSRAIGAVRQCATTVR